jgi:hypothetical protein
MCTNCNCCNHTCRKKAIDDDAGPSEVKKQKKQKKKKATPNKKKTPAKRKQKRAEANPAPTVVSSIRKLLFQGVSA